MEEYEAEARGLVEGEDPNYQVATTINAKTWDRAMALYLLYMEEPGTEKLVFEWYLAGIADSLEIDYQILKNAIKIAAIAK